MDGVYRCEIPDAMNVNQTLYIGVYTNNTGECMMLVLCFAWTLQIGTNQAKTTNQLGIRMTNN